MVKAQETQQTRTIFISSALAQRFSMAPGWTAYTASKCGITGYADAAYAELRQCGMKVSVIYPGLVSTDIGSEFSKDLGKLLSSRVKPEDLLQPQDVTDAVFTLCTPFVGCVSEISLYPQADLFRMRILTEPNRIQKLLEVPCPNFSDKKVALVTGAGKGIGRGVALQLARDGFNLAIIARTPADLESLSQECLGIYKEGHKEDCRVIYFAIDVTDKQALVNAVGSVVEQLGTLSVVVNNAGTNRRKSTALASIEVWEEVVQTNLLASMHLTSLTLPHLLRHAKHSASKSSFLVFINSNYANPSAPTLPGTAVYNATKSALAGFARTALEDVRAWGVKVSTIYPALVNTELGTRPNPQQRMGMGVGAGGGMLLPPSEMIQVEDIAKLVSYTVSCRPNCVISDLAIDTQRNQQPICRDMAAEFALRFWEGDEKKAKL